jgi:hypothetical protein
MGGCHLHALAFCRGLASGRLWPRPGHDHNDQGVPWPCVVRGMRHIFMAPATALADPDSLARYSPSALKLGVIKEARRRQRRRRAALAVVIAASLVAVVVDLGGGGSGPRSPGSGAPRAFRPARTVRPGQVFAESPYMGVSCPTTNLIGCHRVGLAVWVWRSAIITATVDGSALSLNDPTWSSVEQNGIHTVYRYAGFLQPFMWFGRRTASPTVWFRVDFGHGDVVITHEDVPLEPGWG